MLAHLRRSVVLAVICLVFFGFVYAFAGTGVAQLLFRHQADGSITANGSTLIGQNWSDAKCPGHPLGSCVFHGRPDDTGPYAAKPKKRRLRRRQPARGQRRRAASRAAPTSGPARRCCSTNTKELVAYWHRLGVEPDPGPRHHLGQRLRPRHHARRTPWSRSRWSSKATGARPSGLRALIARETHGEQLGFLGSSYIDVLQLNEALAKLK